MQNLVDFVQGKFHVFREKKLEGRACYAGLLLAPAEGFGQLFFDYSGKKLYFYHGPTLVGHGLVATF